jgi:hypothetical protein
MTTRPRLGLAEFVSAIIALPPSRSGRLPAVGNGPGRDEPGRVMDQRVIRSELIRSWRSAPAG